MASIDKRPTGGTGPAGGSIRVGLEDRHFDRKGDADRFLDGVRRRPGPRDVHRPGRRPDAVPGLRRAVAVGQVHRRSTATQCETYLRVHAYPDSWAPTSRHHPAQRGAGVGEEAERAAGAGSVEVAYRWVATILKAAVGDRLIAASPCIQIALPKKLVRRGRSRSPSATCLPWPTPSRSVQGADRLRRRYGDVPGRVLRPDRRPGGLPPQARAGGPPARRLQGRRPEIRATEEQSRPPYCPDARDSVLRC